MTEEQKEEERKRKIAKLTEQVRGLRLTAAQKKVIADISGTILDYNDQFIDSVGCWFKREWDPGSCWEIREADGSCKIVRVELPELKETGSEKTGVFRTGQSLRIWSSVVPEDVVVRECLGQQAYKVQSELSGRVFVVAEKDLYDPTQEEDVFNEDFNVGELFASF